MHVFEGRTAEDAWLAARRVFAEGQTAAYQCGRDGPTRELLHAVLSVAEPQQRWIAARRPPVNPAFAIAETLWMVWGRNDEALPVFFSNSFRRFNGPGPQYGGAYGDRLRKKFGIDQLERCAEALSSNSDSRQVVLEIWSATDDLPNPDGSPRRADIPCNVVSMLKVRDGRLHWTQILRSNDLILGVPYNFVQFTTLQEIVAGWLGVGLGPYTHLSDSLHVYERDLANLAATNGDRAMRNTDILALPIPESRDVLSEIERRVDELIRPSLTPVALEELASAAGLPRGYANLLAIMCAESARRRRWLDLANACAGSCTNAALTQLWQSWAARVIAAGRNR